MICADYMAPEYFIYTKDIPVLVYYSHFTSLLVSLFIGIFIYFKNRDSIVGKVLFAMVLIFSWHIFDSLMTWVNNSSSIVFFYWSLWNISVVLLCLLSLYFFYVFADQKDISFKKKLILGALFLPVAILSPTSVNLEEYNMVDCGGVDQTNLFAHYMEGIVVLVIFWVLIVAFLKYRKMEKERKTQFMLMIIGIEFFLLSFFVLGFLAAYLPAAGYSFIESYMVEQYGLFGMTFFMGIIAYLATRYKASNLKMVGIQLLIGSLMIIIIIQIFLMENLTDKVMSTITLLFLMLFGWFTISIQVEIRKKEELEKLANRLQAANDQLIKLDAAKSEFITIASHKLRTPMTAIKGFSSMLLEGAYGKIEEKPKDVVNKIYLSNNRLITLAEDLLAVSNIDAGKTEYKYEKVNLEEIVKEAVDSFLVPAKGKNLTLTIDLPKAVLPLAMTDKTQIKEVLYNILDNAIKYTPEGGVTIGLAKEEGFIKISLKDTGIGIGKEEAESLFTKFARGKGISELNTEGNGLGLHVSRSVMQALGGKITFSSEGEGKGTTFVVYVPIEAGEKGKE